MKQRFFHLHNIYLPVVFFFYSMIISCGNTMKDVEAINATSETPQESLEKTKMVYTDSGRVKAILTSPEVQHFTIGRKGFLFPKGLQVEFFDAKGNCEARLNSNFGEYADETGLLELQRNVRFVNFRQSDTLLTEHLIWNRKIRKVFTNTHVEIRSPRGILEGDSLVANENFTKYQWVNVRGKHYFNESDTTTNENE